MFFMVRETHTRGKDTDFETFALRVFLVTSRSHYRSMTIASNGHLSVRSAAGDTEPEAEVRIVRIRKSIFEQNSATSDILVASFKLRRQETGPTSIFSRSR